MEYTMPTTGAAIRGNFPNAYDLVGHQLHSKGIIQSNYNQEVQWGYKGLELALKWIEWDNKTGLGH